MRWDEGEGVGGWFVCVSALMNIHGRLRLLLKKILVVTEEDS